MNPISDVTCVSVAVTNQDDGLDFFTGKLGFEIRRDAHISDTFRWVTVAEGLRDGMNRPGVP